MKIAVRLGTPLGAELFLRSTATASTIALMPKGPAAVGDRVTYPDGDTVPVSSAGLSFALEETNDKVHLLDGGKVKTTFDVTGVEVVNLTLGTSAPAYAPTGTDFLAGLILTGATSALLHTFDDSFGEHWFKLDLGTGTLGTELLNVLDAARYDGADLLGVKVTGQVGAVVRYSIAGGTSTPITATSWSGQYSSASGTALV